MEDETTGRGRCVDVFGQGAEACAAFLDHFDDVEKIAQGSGQAVILGDDDHIPIAELVEKAIELRPFAE